MTRTTITTDVDFERDGKQTGHLFLPHSPHEDAWGAITIPVAVVRNGTGPTVLLSGGVHGDEYEGPIAEAELVRTLDPAELRGRLIVVPSLNAPAAFAGNRLSPADGLNMNRTFPGDPFGSASQQISYYAEHVLYPMADLVMDLHSGGSSLQILPSAIVEPCPDAAAERRNLEACLTFDAPFTVRMAVAGDPRTSTAAAVRQGRVVIGSELGGSGIASPEGIEVARRGIRNVLVALGMLEPRHRLDPAGSRTRLLSVPPATGRVLAPCPGVFIPAQRLGEQVQAGAIAGWIHSLAEPWREPIVVRFQASGIVWSHRAIGRSVTGSCLAVVAEPWDPDADK